jgi:hypothetical protein
MASKPRRPYFSASAPAARHSESVASKARYVGHWSSNSLFAAVNFEPVSAPSRRSLASAARVSRRQPLTSRPRWRRRRVADDVGASLSHVELQQTARIHV